MVPSFFILFLLLTSCAAKFAEGIERFAYKECYKLDKNEKLLPIDTIVSEKYSFMSELGKHQIPLNRAFQNINYETYIGLALNSNSENLYEDHLKTSDLNIIQNRKDKNRFYLMFSKNDVFVYRMIYNEPVQKVVVVMNFVSDNEKTITELYNQNDAFLSSKINCGKK